MSGRPTELLDLARSIAAQARDGEQIEVYAARSRRVRVRAYDGEVESLTSAESAGIGVRVVVGGRQGFAHAGSLDPTVAAEVLADARDNAEFGERDPWFGLVSPDGVPEPALELFRPELAAFPSDRKVDLALELERATRSGDPRVFGVRVATYGDAIGESALASSAGVAARSEATSCSLSVQALARKGDETQAGGGFDVGREPGQLDVARAAAEAVREATQLLGATKPPSQRTTIVLDPPVAASFLSIVGGMLSGERVLKGRTPFADRLGEVIASPLLTLVDDATDARSLAADTHDGEGLATRRTVLVDGGVLTAFLHNGYTARRAGTVSTASAVRGYSSTPGVGPLALQVVPGTMSQDELLALVGDGVLITGVSGLHSGVNAVSGDFSVGAEGFVIRGGQRAEPVREFTIASTLQRMLLDLKAVGADLDWRYGDAASSLVIADVSISGT